MLAHLKMELEISDGEIGVLQSSNLQGCMMEMLDESYAEYLHHQKWNPYSMYIEKGEHTIWHIQTLNKEAYERIICVFMKPENAEFEIKKKHLKVRIVRKEVQCREKKELVQKFYFEDEERYLNLIFLTPTAFKSKGQYIIMPNIRLIFQSFMNKYSAASNEMDMFDEEILEQLMQNTKIVNYRLRSTYFALEGIRIPAFKGELSIKITGNETIARYARLLAEFGEYSGVGIKTSMGMGAIRLKKYEKKGKEKS